jgi:hypothetical protein
MLLGPQAGWPSLEVALGIPSAWHAVIPSGSGNCIRLPMHIQNPFV